MWPFIRLWRRCNPRRNAAPDNVTAVRDLVAALNPRKLYRESIEALDTAMKSKPEDARLGLDMVRSRVLNGDKEVRVRTCACHTRNTGAVRRALC